MVCGKTDVVEISRQRVKASINKIPEFMREVQPKAFEPCLVSFGPYHYGKPHLVAMEAYKKDGFFNFTNKYNLEFLMIVENVCGTLENLLGSYDKLEDEWKQDLAKFLKFMIVDACFMLDFFMKCPDSLRSVSDKIRRDMLLLENQLPLNLLRRIYTLAHKNQKDDDIQGLRSLICKSMLIDVEAVKGQDLHILEMYRASLLHPLIENKDYTRKKKEYEQLDPDCQIIPQALKLREAGIKFKISDTKSLAAVSFNPKQGVLKLPHLIVDDDSETKLLNVMAFEKLHMKAGSKVTSFIILMNNLIHVDEDVAFLVSNKILTNALGNNKNAADLFSLLRKGAALEMDTHITNVLYMVSRHWLKAMNPCRCWWTNLTPDYLQHKWALISVLAASFDFAIIIVQLAYQIADYNRGN